MGFRSTFTSSDWPVRWPEWFVSKWGSLVHFRPEGYGSISSISEKKYYGSFEDLPKDIQSVLAQDNPALFSKHPFVLIYLHECGGVSRCKIKIEEIVWDEPDDWNKVEEISHYYCVQC